MPARQHLGMMPFAQRLRGEDEIVDRHHPRLDLAIEPIEIAIAGDQQPIRFHLAPAGADHRLAAFLAIGEGAGVLADARTGLLRGGGDAERPVERMQMPATVIDDAAMIDRRAEQRGHALLLDIFDVDVAIVAREMLDFMAVVGEVVLLVTGMDEPSLRSQAMAWREIRS